jgi:hypothetical protein
MYVTVCDCVAACYCVLLYVTVLMCATYVTITVYYCYSTLLCVTVCYFASMCVTVCYFALMCVTLSDCVTLFDRVLLCVALSLYVSVCNFVTVCYFVWLCVSGVTPKPVSRFSQNLPLFYATARPNSAIRISAASGRVASDTGCTSTRYRVGPEICEPRATLTALAQGSVRGRRVASRERHWMH